MSDCFFFYVKTKVCRRCFY